MAVLSTEHEDDVVTAQAVFRLVGQFVLRLGFIYALAEQGQKGLLLLLCRRPDVSPCEGFVKHRGACSHT